MNNNSNSTVRDSRRDAETNGKGPAANVHDRNLEEVYADTSRHWLVGAHGAHVQRMVAFTRVSRSELVAVYLNERHGKALQSVEFTGPSRRNGRTDMGSAENGRRGGRRRAGGRRGVGVGNGVWQRRRCLNRHGCCCPAAGSRSMQKTSR